MKIITIIVSSCLLLIISCTGSGGKDTRLVSTLSQAIMVQGTDVNDNQTTSSGIYGKKIIINININTLYLEGADGTEYIITPEFTNKGTPVPSDDIMDWSFQGGQKSVLVKKGLNDHYIEQLSIAVKPSLKYYYHNFLVNILATRVDTKEQVKSPSGVEVNIFGLMEQNTIGKVYLGSYDYNKNEYKLPDIIGYPIIRDDGQMLLNKLITNNNPSIYPQGLQEVMVTAYQGDHTEIVLGHSDLEPSCMNGDYSLIGNFVYGISNANTDQSKAITWAYLSPLIGSENCKTSDGSILSNLFYMFKGEVHRFDNSVKSISQISSDGVFVSINDNALFNLSNNNKYNLSNADSTHFVKGYNHIQGLADNGLLLAYDNNNNHNDWLLCNILLKNCSAISQLHSEAPILSDTATISNNGVFIYAVLTKGTNKLLLFLDRRSQKPAINIVLPGINLNMIKITKMMATNQGILLLQFEDATKSPMVRTTMLYSSNFDKWITAPKLLTYFGISRYLVNGSFHGDITVSPNGTAIGMYITNLSDDQFNIDNMSTTAIVTYKFNSDYLPLKSLDDLIRSIA